MVTTMLDIFIKQFIEENIDIIENNNWDEIYNSKMPYYFGDYNHTGCFTQVILECNINPLLYMKEVPEAYMYKSIAPNLNIYIPEGVEKISRCAFHNALIKSLHLPKSLKKIDTQGWALPKNVPIYVPYADFEEFARNIIMAVIDWSEYILVSSITNKRICPIPAPMDWWKKLHISSPSNPTTANISKV